LRFIAGLKAGLFDVTGANIPISAPSINKANEKFNNRKPAWRILNILIINAMMKLPAAEKMIVYDSFRSPDILPLLITLLRNKTKEYVMGRRIMMAGTTARTGRGKYFVIEVSKNPMANNSSM
jgi:hypothetical protein